MWSTSNYGAFPSSSSGVSRKLFRSPTVDAGLNFEWPGEVDLIDTLEPEGANL